MNIGVMGDVTAPYSRLESWFYDAFVAKALGAFYERMDQEVLAGLDRGGKVLDVGCGGGQLLAHLAETRPDLRLTGVDLSIDQVARANRRLVPFSGRARVLEGSALSLPFEDNSFDVVMSVGSIKHWPDQARGLAECLRVARPGGKVGIIEADRGCRLKDVRSFAKKTRVPRLFHPVFAVFYCMAVAGPSLDMDDMRELAGTLPWKECEVFRTEGAPGLAFVGVKG